MSKPSSYENSLQTQRFPFHIVDPSPWPFFTSVSVFASTINMVNYFHGYSVGIFMYLSSLLFLLIIFIWWRDVVREGTFGGYHTNEVQNGLRFGMLLFIISEIAFFFAFFWGFFHSSLSPNIEIGNIWPPKGIFVFNPWTVPLLNTLILLLSGCSVTWAHHSMVLGNNQETIKGLNFTIFLAIFFTFFQYLEYQQAEFRISDSIYGSVFFLATGFHGFHIIIGTIFLSYCLYRLLNFHFTIEHHFGFEAACWYWHFVDIVWLFLYISIYWWGSLKLN
nr:cytochrome c oxidase subunit 3 [Dixoniella grisea]UNJ18987.1 cytochrome c oxidase subunit 3 [Dixoniella grisea]